MDIMDLEKRIIELYDLGLSYDRIAKSCSCLLDKKVTQYKVMAIVNEQIKRRVNMIKESRNRIK